MKGKKYYLMALAGLLMTACSEDMETPAPGQGDGGKTGKVLTFLFSGTAQGYVPYTKAEGGIASNAENELSTLDIYVFGEDSLSSASTKPVVLEEILRSGTDAVTVANTFTLTTSGKDNLVTVSVGEGKKKKFYFVANARDQLSLADIRLNQTDTTAFKEKLSNSQRDLIACPMQMSGSCEVVMSEVSKDTPVKVELVRRVARFDIKNDSEETNFVIQQIALSNVPEQGPLFSGNNWDKAKRVQLPLIDFSTVTGSNAGMAPSVFYLYPTKKTTVDTGGEILFNLIGHNSISPEAQVVQVKFFDIHGDPVSVEANHRYTVEVAPAGQGSLTATLEVEDWLVGDTVKTQTNWGSIELSCENEAFKDNTLTLEAEKPADEADVVTLSVACEGEWDLEMNETTDWLGVEKVVVAEGGVPNSFTVKTLKTNYSSEQRQVIVTVVNKNQPSIRQPLLVVQKGNESSAFTFSADLSSIGGASLIGNILKVPANQNGAIAVTVTTKVSDWTLKGGESYTGLTVSKSNAVLTITPTANTSTRNRINTITLTDGSGNELTTLQVIQSGVNPGTIVLKCTDLEETGTGSYSLAVDAAGFPDEGTSTELNNHRKISVVATTKWNYRFFYPWDDGEGIEQGEEWLSVYNSTEEGQGITENLGTHNGYFYLKATKNTGEARSARVRILDTVTSTSSATITVTQAAGSI